MAHMLITYIIYIYIYIYIYILITTSTESSQKFVAQQARYKGYTIL